MFCVFSLDDDVISRMSKAILTSKSGVDHSEVRHFSMLVYLPRIDSFGHVRTMVFSSSVASHVHGKWKS